MVAFSKNQNIRYGSGFESLLKSFTVHKYGDEMHARSLDPNHFLQGYSYVGPGTEIKLREKIGDDKPLNDLDKYAKDHDYAYLKEQEEYKQDHDKPKHIKNIHYADDIFINEAKNSRDDPIVGRIASNLIDKKEKLEKAGILDTKKFSGIGINESHDPTLKLKQLINEKYKNENHKTRNNKIIKHRSQTGGIIPLAALIPVGIAALGTLAGKVTSDIYDFVKRKIKGSGIKMNHKSHNDKKEFLLQLIKHI